MVFSDSPYAPRTARAVTMVPEPSGDSDTRFPAQLRDILDFRAFCRNQMQIFAIQVRDHAETFCRARLAEWSFAFHRKRHDVRLRQPGIDHPVIHRNHVGDRSLGSHRRYDQPCRSAGVRVFAAANARRMAQNFREKCTDGKISSRARSGGDLKRNPLRQNQPFARLPRQQAASRHKAPALRLVIRTANLIARITPYTTNPLRPELDEPPNVCDYFPLAKVAQLAVKVTGRGRSGI